MGKKKGKARCQHTGPREGEWEDAPTPVCFGKHTEFFRSLLPESTADTKRYYARRTGKTDKQEEEERQAKVEREAKGRTTRLNEVSRNKSALTGPIGSGNKSIGKYYLWFN